MEKTPAGHQKLLQDIERLLAEAPDEASRRDLERLRESLNSPQMLDMAREVMSKPRSPGTLMLDFHDPLLPSVVTAAGGVIAAALCLYAVMLGFDQPAISVGGSMINLWIVAAFAGAVSASFTALSFSRTFTVRFDTEGMLSRASGSRWRRLYTGAMNWKSIRSLQERPADRVLEVRAASGEVFEIPMKVVNYRILREHLDNMVLLYGDTTGAEVVPGTKSRS
ncbi:MAG TPA: hypothetical protein VFU13_02605 [Steroidobacteraceae bacterium]|nr:hypothetical protein [Steroidobacteraceae bacterium]